MNPILKHIFDSKVDAFLNIKTKEINNPIVVSNKDFTGMQFNKDKK